MTNCFDPYMNCIGKQALRAGLRRSGQSHLGRLSIGALFMGYFRGVLSGIYKGAITGALIIRIRFWGPLYYNYNKEPLY